MKNIVQFKKFVALLVLSALFCFMHTNAFAVTQHAFGDRNEKNIAITIDDGFDKTVWADFLNFAKEKHIPLTFFIVGNALKDLEQDAPLLKRTLDEGHELGSHNNVHMDMTTWSYDRIARQLRKLEEKFSEALGFNYKPTLVRFPYGKSGHKPMLKNYAQACEQMGYEHIIHWDVGLDSPTEMLKRIRNGSIVLLHTNPKDFRVFTEIFDTLKHQGYNFVTVSQLLHLNETQGSKP